MKNIRLEVIPEPQKGTATVIRHGPTGPQIMMKGNGDTNYVCGTCGSTILENMQRGQVVNIVFRCFKCGSFNLIKGT